MKTYTGGCHCGKVRYKAEADIDTVIACNCSNCGMRGLLLKFVPEEQFTLTEGEDSLKDYRFNKKKIAHMVCTHCGVEPFGRGENSEGARMIALNVRCFDDTDPESFPKEFFDGKNY